MKSRKFNFFLFSTLLAILGFNSGTFAQSYVEIGAGTQNTSLPFYSSWNYSWSSLIYTQASLGTAKTITKIGFNVISGAKTLPNQKIYIKHTSNTAFGSAGYEDPANNGYTLVYDGVIAFQNGWNEIDITDFAYNGTDNLIVHCENRWGQTYGPQFASTPSSTNNNKSAGADNSFPTTGGYLNPYPSSLTNIRFYYASSGPTTPAIPVPASDAVKTSVSTSLSFNLGTNTMSYDLYFGTDSAQVASLNAAVKVVNNATVTTPGAFTYTPTALLTPLTKYFWRVSAKNSTAIENSTLWKFTTQRVITTMPWNEGFEDSTVFYPGWLGLFTDWTYPSSGNNAFWGVSTQLNAHSGSFGTQAVPFSASTEASLMTPRIYLPVNYRVTFWWRNGVTNTKIAGSDTTFFEITNDGGLTWHTLDILSPAGVQTTFVQSVNNVSAYAGNNVYLRWRYKKSNSNCKNTFIDDIVVESMPNGAILTLGGSNMTFNELYTGGKTKKRISIKNTGVTNLTVTSVTSTAPFVCNYTATLAPNQTDSITVWYMPTSAGSHTGTITVNSNGTGVNTVNLSGNALAVLSNFTETFESTPVNTIPSHWNKLKSTDPYQTVNDIAIKNSPSDAHSVPNVIKFYNNTDTISPLILITPGVTGFSTDTLKFWASKSFGNFNTVKLIVGVMDDPYDGLSFVPKDTIELSDTMTLYKATFDPTNTKPYIGFKHAQLKAISSIWIDDINWQSAANIVPNPTAAVFPLNNSVDNIITPTIKWTNTGGNPTGYRISFGTNNPPTNMLNNVDMGTALQYQGTTLLAFNTIYYWQIAPYNTNGNAVNCPVWNFKTMNDPTITSFPWDEGFESITPSTGFNYPLGWTIENGNEQSYCWDVITNNATNPNNAHTGQKAIHTAFSMLTPMNDWLFTPPLQLTGGESYDFSFWIKANPFIQAPDTSFEKFEVRWGSGPDSLMMDGGLLYRNELIRIPNYTKLSYSFSPATSGKYYISFHTFSLPLQWILLLDDVRVQVSTSVTENNNVEFKTYPNPNNGQFMIQLPENLSNARIIVCDMIGQTVIDKTMQGSSSMIDLSGMTKGIYLVNVISNNKSGVQKILVK
jgi:hypothetical protein